MNDFEHDKKSLSANIGLFADRFILDAADISH
jgi:hypothetical protein